MRIKLINKKNYKKLKNIYKKFPHLTLNNRGYEYINRHSLNKEELEAIEEIQNILKTCISGFSSFTNFRDNNTKKLIEIRFQYNYNYDTNNNSFTGVGYIYLVELLQGFIPLNKKR